MLSPKIGHRCNRMHLCSDAQFNVKYSDSDIEEESQTSCCCWFCCSDLKEKETAAAAAAGSDADTCPHRKVTHSDIYTQHPVGGRTHTNTHTQATPHCMSTRLAKIFPLLNAFFLLFAINQQHHLPSNRRVRCVCSASAHLGGRADGRIWRKPAVTHPACAGKPPKEEDIGSHFVTSST